MTDSYLYEFGADDRVTEMAFARSGDHSKLTVSLITATGPVRLMFFNPGPEDRLTTLVDASELWVRSEPDSNGVRVDYWAGDYESFVADCVVDLDASAYDTNPGRVRAQTQPISLVGLPLRRE